MTTLHEICLAAAALFVVAALAAILYRLLRRPYYVLRPTDAPGGAEAYTALTPAGVAQATRVLDPINGESFRIDAVWDGVEYVVITAPSYAMLDTSLRKLTERHLTAAATP